MPAQLRLALPSCLKRQPNPERRTAPPRKVCIRHLVPIYVFPGLFSTFTQRTLVDDKNKSSAARPPSDSYATVRRACSCRRCSSSCIDLRASEVSPCDSPSVSLCLRMMISCVASATRRKQQHQVFTLGYTRSGSEV